MLLFGSSMPLALTAAVLYRRLRALGITTRGSAITLVGGVLAAGALSLSGIFGWAGGRLPADAERRFGQGAGRPGVPGRGPGLRRDLRAAPSPACPVTGLLAGLLHRASAWAGLVLAAVGMLATLAFVVDGSQYLVPVVRFGGLIWLIVAASVLPRTRRRNA